MESGNCETDDPKAADKCKIHDSPPQPKTSARGKENLECESEAAEHKQAEKFCFECNKPLARSRHLIEIAGQTNKSWHPECFRCNVCSSQLDRETSCHVYKDKIICKQDYLKLQRDKLTKCSRCQWPISASDWVRRAGSYVYHLACFSCDICLRQLSTGEQFTLSLPKQAKGNAVRLLCRLHFAIDASAAPKPPAPLPPGYQQDQPAGESSPDVAGMGSSSFEYNSFVSFQQTRNKSRDNKFASYHQEQYLRMLQQPTGSAEQTSMIERAQQLKCAASAVAHLPLDIEGRFEGEDLLIDQHLLGGPNDLNQELMAQRHANLTGEPGSSTSTASSTNGSTSGNLMGLGPSKSKRVRTTFTEDQLSILQTHFQIDSNPDGQDLERIATITGLSKRVTQVWFQNSRARQKKYMIKRKPNSSVASSVAASFSANIASSLAAASEGHSSLSAEGGQHKRAMTDTYQLSVNEELRKQRQKWCSEDTRRLDVFEAENFNSPGNLANEEDDNEDEEEEDDDDEEDRVILSEDDVSDES